MDYFKKFSNNSHAIFFTILTCFLMSMMVGIVRHLVDDFHPFFVLFMRNLVAFFLFMPMMFRGGKKIFHTKTPKLHLLRGVNGLIGMLIWFYIVDKIPLPELISFTFLVPIMTTFAAMLFLKEKVGKRAWLALLIGFVGILIITRPGYRDLNIAYLLALTTTISWSSTNLLVKVMTRTERSRVIVMYMTIIILVLSTPFGVIYFKPFGFVDFLWFLSLGMIASLSQMSLSYAFSKADLSVVQPFDFMRLIFTSIIAYFAFDQVLDSYTLVGSLVIMVGVVFAASKKKKKRGYYSDELSDV